MISADAAPATGGPGADARTHCPFCAFQCGMFLRQRPAPESGLAVVGDPSFPVNLGRLCIKGFNATELLDHPQRLRAPQVRGADGRLREASWPAALDLVAERLAALRERHGPECLAAFGSDALTNEKAYWLGKFVRVALGSPFIDYNGRFCMASAAAGQNRAFGIDRGLPFPVADIAGAEVLVLWGANSADTMPPLLQWVDRQRTAGHLIVVDPRRTQTAQLAHEHLRLTPGTDLALANGLLALALDEHLVDEDYVAARTVGFDAVRRAVRALVPVQVERLTGVSVEQQLRVVRKLAGAERSMLLSGRGPEQQSKGTDTVSALINLMLALGKVGRPSSGYGTLTGQGNGQGGREHGQKADQLPGYRLIENPDDRAAVAKQWGIDVADLPGKGKSAQELLESLGPRGGIRALLVFGSNLAVAAPDTTALAARLRTLELLVVCDAFANETAELAHVILPVTQWAEEEGTTTNLEGRVLLRRRLREPPPETRSDLAILSELAARLGKAAFFPTAAPREIWDELRRVTAGAKADYAGISYERLAQEGGVYWPCPEPSHPGTPRLFEDRFAHPDGKARFVPVRHRPSAEVPDAAYPLYFITGRYREHYNSGAQTRRVAALTEVRPRPLVQVHPHLAQRLGVGAGDALTLESRRGLATFAVELSTDMREDTVFAPMHWGGAGSANRLTIAALDPTSRMPEFKLCAVRARPAALSAAIAPESARD